LALKRGYERRPFKKRRSFAQTITQLLNSYYFY